MKPAKGLWQRQRGPAALQSRNSDSLQASHDQKDTRTLAVSGRKARRSWRRTHAPHRNKSNEKRVFRVRVTSQLHPPGLAPRTAFLPRSSRMPHWTSAAARLCLSFPHYLMLLAGTLSPSPSTISTYLRHPFSPSLFSLFSTLNPTS